MAEKSKNEIYKSCEKTVVTEENTAECVSDAFSQDEVFVPTALREEISASPVSEEQTPVNTVSQEEQTSVNTVREEQVPVLSEEEKLKAQKKKRRNSILLNVLFLVINAIIVLVLLLLEDKSGDKVAGSQAMKLFAENWYYTALAFFMYFVIAFSDSIVFAALIKKTGVKSSPALPLKVSFMGRYYDRITPWSMGGEPFQVATLMRGGLSGGDSCAVTMSRHIVRFFSTAIAVIVILIASRITTNVYVMVVAILSVAAGLIIPSFMLLCAFKPKIGLKIGEGVINFLHKIKIVKNYDKQLKKMQNDVNNFLSGIKYLSTNKAMIALIAFSAIVELFANNSVPFFVIRGLGHTEVTFWHTLVLCIFVNYASSFAPTPGGAGIAELSFYAIFAAYVEEGYLFWAVLFWRIAIFFVPVFIGFALQIFDSVKNIFDTRKSR